MTAPAPAAATTPCPRCRHPIEVIDEPDGQATCPACELRVTFIDVPDRPCDRCGSPVALPGPAAVRCLACDHVQAAEVGRAVRFEARCPRCRRRVEVPADDDEAPCPACGAMLALSDTL